MVRVAIDRARKIGSTAINMDIPQDMHNARVLLAGVRHISDFRNEPEGDWSPDRNTVRHFMVFVSFFATWLRFRTSRFNALCLRYPSTPAERYHIVCYMF